ncbi:hypothetical protein HDU79_010603 [Rhizoclosmatium sp. JEL0117]|nr:hypothetical protein HDU79_010603 [Rhizoclosmatium sp. JEL0117]
MGVQPRYQRPPQHYVPNGAKFDGLSSNKEAYQPWPINSRPSGRHSVPYAPLKDDRDFKSTTAAAYIGHPMDGSQNQDAKGPYFFLPSPDTKFEGQTTSQDAYRKWNVKPRDRRAKVQYVPNTSKFPTDTTYTDNYQAKSLPADEGGRPSKFGPTYTPVASCKFEGISTHKADYLPTGHVHRLPDFAPKKGFIYQKDDRDFVTTSRKAHDFKSPTKSA